jgi:[acyl-carrier-protein] S-malonyltransferase
VFFNVTADSESDPDTIKTLMARQITHPVRWYDTVLRMQTDAVGCFVEIGPGRVLTGLLRKILPRDYEAGIHNVYDLKTLEKYLNTAA